MQRSEINLEECRKCGEICESALITGDRRKVICLSCLEAPEERTERERMLAARELFFEIMGTPDIISEDQEIGVNIVHDEDDLHSKLDRFNDELVKRGLKKPD